MEKTYIYIYIHIHTHTHTHSYIWGAETAVVDLGRCSPESDHPRRKTISMNTWVLLLPNTRSGYVKHLSGAFSNLL